MGRRKKREEAEEVFAPELPQEKKPLPVITVTDAQWHSLWVSLNKNRTDTIRVNKKALAAVLADFEPGEGLIITKPRPSSDSVEVDRAILFKFLNYVGRTYGEREREITLAKKAKSD